MRCKKMITMLVPAEPLNLQLFPQAGQENVSINVTELEVQCSLEAEHVVTPGHLYNHVVVHPSLTGPHAYPTVLADRQAYWTDTRSLLAERESVEAMVSCTHCTGDCCGGPNR